MREKVRTDFAQRLLEARTRKGLSQPQLAKLAGVAQGTIGEAETTAIGSKHTAKLAAVLGVRAEWLATGTGSMLDDSAWPLSDDLFAVVLSLDPQQREQLEGVIRAHLGVSQKDGVTDTYAAPHVRSKTDSSVKGRTDSPSSQRSAVLAGQEVMLGGSNGRLKTSRKQPGGAKKPGSNRGPRKAA